MKMALYQGQHRPRFFFFVWIIKHHFFSVGWHLGKHTNHKFGAWQATQTHGSAASLGLKLKQNNRWRIRSDGSWEKNIFRFPEKGNSEKKNNNFGDENEASSPLKAFLRVEFSYMVTHWHYLPLRRGGIFPKKPRSLSWPPNPSVIAC